MLKKFSFLFFEKMARALMVAIVTFVFAKELGPEEFGFYNYVVAFISIFASVCYLGMNGILTKELRLGDLGVNELLTSAIYLYIFSSFLLYFLFIFFGDTFFNGKLGYFLFFLPLKFIFDFGFIFKCYLESQHKVLEVAKIEFLVLFFFFVVKLIYIFYFDYPEVDVLYAFLLCEVLFCSFFIFFYFSRFFQIKFEKICVKNVKYILSRSYPLLLASVAWMLYTRLDQVMIGWLASPKEVAYYSLAIRFLDVTVIFTGVILSLLFPVVVDRKKNGEEYRKYFSKIYKINNVFFYLYAIFVLLFSEGILEFIFGGVYEKTSNLLIVLCWVGLFSGMAMISGRFYVLENMQKVTMYRHIFGLLSSFVLNIILIPKYGALGAAWSSLAAMVMSSFLYDFFTKETRFVFFQKLNSIFIWDFIKND